jgi:hypothetical protein
MSKGVAGQVGSSASTGGSAAVSDRVPPVGVHEPTDGSGSGVQRRRRRRYRHHHNHNLQKRSGKEYEFAFVTLVAIAILFWILFTLLPRWENRSNSGEESHLAPAIPIPVLPLSG